ncbi:MAG: hypothetical protein PHO41_03815 [Eubacteriales bacterium]|nr:hypothetical protein [Eubacteriales bacterium]
MATHSELSKARIARRSIWYIMRTVVIIVALAALCYGAFVTAMRASNLYILTTEGLKLRAECALMDGSRESLGDYFTSSFIDTDTMLNTDDYDAFTVTDYDYRVSVTGMSVWPWSTTATVTVVDNMVSVNGSYNAEQTEQDGAEEQKHPLPEWKGAKYKLYFSYSDERWFLYQMQLLEAAPSEAPKRTPDLRMSPLPVPTPTPDNIVME